MEKKVYGLLKGTNGKYKAIRLLGRNANVISGNVLILASSKKSLISKIIANGFGGYLEDGLIQGLNEGEIVWSHQFTPL